MKRTKAIALLLTLSILILALSGCGKMTTEKLAVKMADAVQDRQMAQSTMEMEMDISFNLEQMGMSLDMALAVDYIMDMKMASDPYELYSETVMNMNMEFLGQSEELTEKIKTHVVMEDGKLVSYVYSDTTGSWERQEMELDQIPANLDYSFLTEKLAELVMDEEKQELDGREVYVVRITLTGEEMQDALNSASGLPETFSNMGITDLDMSTLRIPTVFYVDAKTYLPVQIEMELTGMDEMMNSLLSSALGSVDGLAEVSITNCRAVYKNISFDPVEVPEVPAEAKN